MYSDITDFFKNLIRQTGSYDIAANEFRHQIADDEVLMESYKQWCEEHGYEPREGFARFCEECRLDDNKISDGFNDYDDGFNNFERGN